MIETVHFRIFSRIVFFYHSIRIYYHYWLLAILM